MYTTLGYGGTAVIAQNNFTVDVFTTEFGLPSNYIQSCTVDSVGYLWLATKKGISKYDGYNFNNNNQLRGDVLSLYNANNQLFYYYNNNTGLNELNPYNKKINSIAATKFTDSDPTNDHYNNIFKDSWGNIWCCDFAHVKYFQPTTKSFKSFTLNDFNVSTDRLATILQPNKNEVWIASLFGLKIWTKQNDTLTLFPDNSINKRNFSTAAIVGNDSVIAASGNQFYLINTVSKKNIQTYTLPSNDAIVSITCMYNNGIKNILIATQQKVFILNANNSKPSIIYIGNDNDGIINSIYCAPNSHYIWVCTTQGLVKLTAPSNAIKTFAIPNTVQGENAVKQVIKIASNNYCILTTVGELYLSDLYTSFKKIALPTQANFISWTGNQLLIGTNNGLLVFDGSYVKPMNAVSNTIAIKKILITKKYVWLLLKDAPPLVLNNPTFSIAQTVTVQNNNIFGKDNIWNDIIEDDEAQIFLAGWMPSNYGLAQFNFTNNSFEPIARRTNKEAMFIGDYFNRIAKSKKYHLLFSGYGGFNMINEKGIATKIVSVDHYKIINDHVEGIAELNDGKIWFGTEEGIQVWNPATDQLFALTTQIGLPSNTAIYAFDVIDTNSLAVGFNKKVSIINTDKIFERTLQEKLVLASLKVNDSLVDVFDNTITLNPSQRNLQFSFSALNFSDTKKIHYQYAINNGAWQNLDHIPTLTFSNFKPGTYNIAVRVSDNLDMWQNKQLLLTIIAKPKFIETIWFIILLAAIGIAIGWALFKFRLNQLRRINQFRANISQDLHDDVGATLSSINILSTMLSESTTLADKPKTYVQKINTDVQQLQLKLDEIIWSLKKEENSIQQIFNKLINYGTYIFDAKNINFTHQLPNDAATIFVPNQHKRSIYLLVKEALNNIAKHSQAQHAALLFTHTNKQLSIVIKDDGKGINQANIDKRNGIKGMHQRATEIGAQVFIDSSSKGTTITLQIKL
ncbi:ATP-binding protein [Ferruginibacter yonginensis]|uniref:ATP-binding protein n=1 Tax=Ferruginibacter yonginensis TaxID=1310416 RepID=A0ABV8QR07_9BACT